MEKISLGKLKDTLNKMPEDLLEGFFLTHSMWLEEPETKFGVVFCCDEEEWEKHQKLFEDKNMEIITEFAKQVETDVKKVIAVQMDEDLEGENYNEDCPI